MHYRPECGKENNVQTDRIEADVLIIGGGTACRTGAITLSEDGIQIDGDKCNYCG